MPSAKETRAAMKRQHRRWRPQSNLAAGRRDILAVAARECGLVLETVPVKNSRFMPETETEKKWLDSYTYCADPSQISDDDARPRKPMTAVDRAAYGAAQDPRMAAIFGS